MLYSNLTQKEKEAYATFMIDPEVSFLEVLFKDLFEEALRKVYNDFKQTERERTYALLQEVEAYKSEAMKLNESADPSLPIKSVDKEKAKGPTMAPVNGMLYNIADVKNMLKRTRATLNNWRRDGILVGRRIGKQRLYTGEEIDAAITKFNLSKGEK